MNVSSVPPGLASCQSAANRSRLAMFGDGPLGLEGVRGDEVEDQARALDVPLQDRVGAFAEGQRVELVERVQQLPELGPRAGRRVDLGPRRVLVAVRDPVHLEPARFDDGADRLEQVRPVEPRHPGHPQDLERVEAPRTRGHHADEGVVVVRVRDRAQRLLEVPDLGGLEQAQAADHRVRDVLVAKPRDDRVAVLVLAVQDRERGERPAGPVRCASPLRDPVHDRDGLVLRAGADEEGDRLAVFAVRHQPLVGLEAGLVAGDQAVGPGQDVAHRPEVLLDPEARRRTGRRRCRDRGPAGARTGRRTRRRRRSWRPGTGRSTGRRRPRP